jgi:nitroimidazol reductase NimA-like FMN-containing flavoprotein (pyridoxamine 5'-phosphate oxidase superfamily)
MEINNFKQTIKTKFLRTPKRGSYDKDSFNQIVDEAKFGHLAFTDENGIHSIPMLCWRYNNFLYFHASIASRLAKLHLQENICISFAILDGYVFAKSAFRHSLNYRSAVIYGKCELVTNDTAEKVEAFHALVDLYDTKRWGQIRQPSQEELNATVLLKLPIRNLCTQNTRYGIIIY